jgi:Ca2+-binding RTX toxin-like protein
MGAGDDSVRGGIGNDTINGGDGSDVQLHERPTTKAPAFRGGLTAQRRDRRGVGPLGLD